MAQQEYLELDPAARYASKYILPPGTSAAEALILERILQNQVMIEKMMARQARLSEVLSREHGLGEDALSYILDGCVFERELGM